LGIASPVHGALVFVIAIDVFAEIGASCAIVPATGQVGDGEKYQCENAEGKSK
jgi:hypothetical protein